MNSKRDFTVPKEYDCKTVKAFARGYLKISSRAFIRQKHEKDGIQINGVHAKSIDLLRENDVLSFNLPHEYPEYKAVMGSLDILYEDENYLAVNKEPNVPVHPSPGHNDDSLLNLVAYHYESSGESHLFRPLYRLDKDTSGIIWVAKNRIAASSTRIEKLYFGLVPGRVCCNGRIDLPIGLQPGSIIVRQAGSGERAVTNWKVLGYDGVHSLLGFKLETGRTHQIRSHMSFIEQPLAGDELYGGSREYIDRQALHCGYSRLISTAYGLDKSITKQLPFDMSRIYKGDSIDYEPWISRLTGGELCQTV